MKARITHKNDREIIDFPDPHFKEYLVSQFDDDGDGEISVDDALGVTTLVVVGRQIENLSGIEYFANLHTLDCSYNKLSILDVRNNLRLRTLRCVANRIFSLKVEGCENLTSLFCSDNLIGYIDLRTNEKLAVLDCLRNKIKMLVLSKNKHLEELQADGNPLEIIEFTGEKWPIIFNVPYSADIVELSPEILAKIDSIRDLWDEN